MQFRLGMETIFDIYSQKEISQNLEKIKKNIQKGMNDSEILEKIDLKLKDELLSIARARLKSEKDLGKYIGDIEYFNLDDYRFSTPINVAEYRAKRLKCNKIVDLCSGIGTQSKAFGKESKEVFSFEIDKRRYEYSKANFMDKNIHFFIGDVLDESIIKKVSEIGPEIIFCDPERLEQEKERNLFSIQPDLIKLIEIYSKITPNLCIELPPQIEIEKLKELEKFGKFEIEYLSVNNKLNRLNIYFGELVSSSISVVDIISEERIEKSSDDADYSIEPKEYLYEASTAILKAGLEESFAVLINASIIKDKGNEKKLLLTSDKLNKDKALAFSKIYQVIGSAKDFNEAILVLRKSHFGSVVLKYNIDPKDYWKERKKYENQLNGKKEATIFIINSKFIICKEVE